MNIFARTRVGNISINGQSMSYVGSEKIKIGSQEFEVDFPVQIIVTGDVHGKVSSMSGDIEINGNCEDIGTMSGDVDVRGTVAGKISTMSGDVDVRA